MKKLGLVGGMGPQSTMPYYIGTVYGVQERTSPDFFPPLTIESVNVFEVLRLIDAGKMDEVTAYLLAAIENLRQAGADFAALTANTAHIVYDRLEHLSPLPLVSIITATRDYALTHGLRRIALLGTRFTMERDFYKTPFIDSGIEIIVPDEDERCYIDRTITSELEYGVVKPETLLEYQNILQRMKDDDRIEAAILGCTELPLLLNDGNSPVPVLDTVKIHTATLVDEILA